MTEEKTKPTIYVYRDVNESNLEKGLYNRKTHEKLFVMICHVSFLNRLRYIQENKNFYLLKDDSCQEPSPETLDDCLKETGPNGGEIKRKYSKDGDIRSLITIYPCYPDLWEDLTSIYKTEKHKLLYEKKANVYKNKTIKKVQATTLLEKILLEIDFLIEIEKFKREFPKKPEGYFMFG